MVKRLFIFCFLLILASCKPQDPSVYDIKSPCASYKKGDVIGIEPCIKRTPLGNKLV